MLFPLSGMPQGPSYPPHSSTAVHSGDHQDRKQLPGILTALHAVNKACASLETANVNECSSSPAHDSLPPFPKERIHDRRIQSRD